MKNPTGKEKLSIIMPAWVRVPLLTGRPAAAPCIPGRLLLITLLAVALVVPRSQSPWAQPSAVSEEKYIAVFLLNCAKVVEIPANGFNSPEDPLVVSVVTPKSLSEYLPWLDGQIVQGRRLTVRPFNEVLAGAPCHILYINGTDRQNWEPILGRFKDRPLMTVGDSHAFLQSGGIIGFLRTDSKIRFEINVDAAKRAGVKIPSKMIQLGVVFREEQQ